MKKSATTPQSSKPIRRPRRIHPLAVMALLVGLGFLALGFYERGKRVLNIQWQRERESSSSSGSGDIRVWFKAEARPAAEVMNSTGAFVVTASVLQGTFGETKDKKVKQAVEGYVEALNARGYEARLNIANANIKPEGKQPLRPGKEARWSVSIRDAGDYNGHVEVEVPATLVPPILADKKPLNVKRSDVASIQFKVVDNTPWHAKLIEMIGWVAGGMISLLTTVHFLWKWRVDYAKSKVKSCGLFDDVGV